MRISCADYTWSLLAHGAALDLVKAIGCTAVDLGFMTERSHVRPERAHGRVAATAGAAAERVSSRGLLVADVFAIAYTDFETMAVNNPDPTQQSRSEEFFTDAVDFAAGVGASGLTTLPGVLFDGDTASAALARSAAGLRRWVDVAAQRGLALSVEPHTGSLIDTPQTTLDLLDAVPGLTITLDYAHYVYGGVAQDDVAAVLPYVRHLQCRPGQPGRLQVRVAEDAIDWPRAVHALRGAGYDGAYALEYVWQEWMDCNQVDTVAESILLREVLLDADDANAEWT